ncbi:rCG32237 [Rattus norvegicus]|uniref:RCG32237 n=1 Tax=Rattus norvegicus TaxID=10116 RepID=A6JWY7_RAT|nr:rCG32237 [Rattus norvegicus]
MNQSLQLYNRSKEMVVGRRKFQRDTWEKVHHTLVVEEGLHGPRFPSQEKTDLEEAVVD